jgi:hypothetical protein
MVDSGGYTRPIVTRTSRKEKHLLAREAREATETQRRLKEEFLRRDGERRAA